MNRVAIVGGCRTAFVRAGGAYKDLSFLSLGVHVLNSVVSKLKLDAETIDELIFSTVLLDPRAPNFAREILLRSGLPRTIGAHAISNNCISGLVAVCFLSDAIRCGRVKVGLAGGSESMSNPALALSPQSERFFLELARARSFPERLAALAQFRPSMLMPLPPSPKEPSTGLTMGQHCEMSAKEFAIERALQDQIALRSHQNAQRAKDAGLLRQEIEAIAGVAHDNLVRGDTSIEKLAKLKPVFDRSPQGTLTAGNSSALTDGASIICLMSEAEARRQKRDILGFIERVEFSALDPNIGLLMAPGVALPKLMHAANLSIDDVDRFEVHEAFAAQVAANMKIWEGGWAKVPSIKPIGTVPVEKLNVNGGSIALGHPFAATGGRLILSLVNELQRNKLRQGLISVCAAGGMACALQITRE